MSEPNRIVEASQKMTERLAVLNDAALHRLMAATSIDTSIARLYETYRVAGFHAGLITADEALTICQSLGEYGFRAETELALRVVVVEAMSIIGRGVGHELPTLRRRRPHARASPRWVEASHHIAPTDT
jgi:hypothetical protein